MLLGARQFFQKSAAGWQNPYVTDGLVAMWDGIWNVGGGQPHDSTSQVWWDCIGGMPIVNSVADNFFASNGLCQAGVRGINGAMPYSPNGYGWVYAEYCVTISGKRSDFAILLVVGDRVLTVKFSASSIGVFRSPGDGWVFPGLDLTSFPKSMTIGYSYPSASSSDNDGVKVWLNGSDTGTVSSAYHDSWTNTKTGQFGITNAYNAIYGYLCDMTIHAIRFYSRVPTSAEITDNYAVDKERFNLP